MGISKRWVQKLWARYKYTEPDQLVYPKPMGRPQKSLPGRLEHSAIVNTRQGGHLSTTRLKEQILDTSGIDTSYRTIYRILRGENLTKKEPKKSKQRKWVRYERDYSNSLWHTNWKLLDCGKWLICYEDDASRFVTGYGVFDHATTENTIAVLETAIKEYGKPTSILTDRGTQFYASQKSRKKISVFLLSQEIFLFNQIQKFIELQYHDI